MTKISRATSLPKGDGDQSCYPSSQRGPNTRPRLRSCGVARKVRFCGPMPIRGRRSNAFKLKSFTPPYDLYYQQGRSAHARIKIRPEHFPTFVSHMRPIAPIVLSIDTAQKGGADSSYNVIQAWSSRGQNHFLLALWRHQCGYADLCAAYRSFLAKVSSKHCPH